jgi:hypothetical protein
MAPLHRKLAETVTLEKGIDAQTPLKDALELLAMRYGLQPVLIDRESFKDLAQVDAPEDLPVKLPRMAGVNLGTVLRQLLAQVRAHYLVRADHLEVVPAERFQAEVWGAGPPPEGQPPRRKLPLVNATYEQRPLEELLQALSDATGFTVVLDARHAGDRAGAPVSALLNNVPLDTAVRLLADQAELEAVLLDNVLQVTTPDQARALQAEQEKLNRRGLERVSPGGAPAAGM